MTKIKAFQIRLNFKSRVAGIKLKPSYTTGLVVANTEKEAKEYALNDFQKWLDEKGEEVDVEIGSIKRIPSSFLLNAKK